MANHTVRVQLKDVDEGDEAYAKLYEAMEDSGFTRTIISKGVEYELPTGSYNYIGEDSGSDVLQRAKKAVKTTGRKARILVTTGLRTWDGLDVEDSEE